MSKDTPWTEGGWVFDYTEGEDRIRIFAAKDTKAANWPKCICSVWTGEPDARLIAKAPEMADCIAENIDSAKRIISVLPLGDLADDIRATLNALIDDCEDALAKARGDQ